MGFESFFDFVFWINSEGFDLQNNAPMIHQEVSALTVNEFGL